MNVRQCLLTWQGITRQCVLLNVCQRSVNGGTVIDWSYVADGHIGGSLTTGQWVGLARQV